MIHDDRPSDDFGDRAAARYLDAAARAALGAFGHAEPNPLVGCAIVKSGQVLAIGHHRRFGGLHAEREALARCRELGADPAGATAYVTLEPCRHHGKQPPCTDALIEAGIARIVCARVDPAPESGGGSAVLAAAGIPTSFTDTSPLATSLAEPFVHRLRTGRPWVIAKWAQTIDGRIATRTGESQWISGEASRRRVHALRGRVDAVVTGIGTVLADDPTLDARDAGTPRRIARRVVLDSGLRTPLGSNLLRTARALPTTVYTADPDAGPAAGIRSTGAEVVGIGAGAGDARPDLTGVLADLAARHGVATVLIEAGPTLLGSLASADLIDEAVVYMAPMLLADAQARPVADGRAVPALSDAVRFRLLRARRCADDLELTFRRNPDQGSAAPD